MITSRTWILTHSQKNKKIFVAAKSRLTLLQDLKICHQHRKQKHDG